MQFIEQFVLLFDLVQFDIQQFVDIVMQFVILLFDLVQFIMQLLIEQFVVCCILESRIK